jgi:glycosyltransferase involved in cell wall biosynthesis
MKTLSALFVQDHNRNGGAARAAGRWARLLDREGHIVKQAAGDEAASAGFLLTGKPPRGWQRIIECFTGKKKERKKEVEQRLGELLAKGKPDFVWFHNIAGGRKWGWSEEMISIARQYSPVIWTLHDMWALGDSRESYWQEDSVVEGGKRKGAGKSRVEGVIGKPGKYPVILTAPSRWLADLAKEWTDMDCVFLPNPIDLEIYSPGNRIEARKRWGLPEEGLVILGGADSLADPRKGFDLLLEAWSRGRKGATLALFGRNGREREGIVNLGSIDTDEAMADAYRAADLYVHPARQENAPCTVQESLACGTPVLAFAVGGIPEMVVPSKTGFLVNEISARSLSNELVCLLANSDKLEQMRSDCRRSAGSKWDPKWLTMRFEEITGGGGSGSKGGAVVGGR